MNTGKPKILIVDDEKGLRFGTQRLLEDEGFDVDTAENGVEGIKLGTTYDYDVAVIDMKMPDIDGLDVLREIKKANPATVCFIATAYASYDTAIESTRLGALSYIPKPFTPDELLNQVQQGLKQRLLIKESEKLKKEREERLLEIANEKSRLNTIIKSISDGVLVINKTGEVVYFNKGAIKYLDLPDLKIGDEIRGKLPEKITATLDKYFKSDIVIQKSYSTQIELKPEKQLFVEAMCSPVTNPDDSLAGVVIVIRNISEMKKIELIKSQFVSMVAHELKTPIAAVQGFINIIADQTLDLPVEKQHEYLSRSSVRLKSLLDLVNDLLDISRMELKTKQREIEDINLVEIINSTVQILELELQKKKIAVTTDYAENLPHIKADVNEITRLFTNILSNAVKYNKENGAIDIAIKATDNYVITKISDTGIGLKEEEKAKLFQEFFRAKNELTRGISGTGLGLTIVKRIVDSYHGNVEVASQYGVGTTFTIHLPINKN